MILYGSEYWERGARLSSRWSNGAPSLSRTSICCSMPTRRLEAFEQLREHLVDATISQPQKRAGGGRAPGIAKTRRIDGSTRRVDTNGHDTGRQLVERYKDGYRAVVDALAGATDGGTGRAARRRASGRAREIVHHLADSEMTSAIRLRLLIADRQPDHRRLRRSEFARRLYYDRPIDASLGPSRRRGSPARDSRAAVSGPVGTTGHTHGVRRLWCRAVARDLRETRAQSRRSDRVGGARRPPRRDSAAWPARLRVQHHQRHVATLVLARFSNPCSTRSGFSPVPCSWFLVPGPSLVHGPYLVPGPW